MVKTAPPEESMKRSILSFAVAVISAMAFFVAPAAAQAPAAKPAASAKPAGSAKPAAFDAGACLGCQPRHAPR
jgi:hypothetical protein